MASEAEAKGIIVKPDACEICQKSGKWLLKHHRSYLKPLDVTWMCRSCHWKEHSDNKSLEMPWWMRRDSVIRKRHGSVNLKIAWDIRDKFKNFYEAN
jgi:hypothetical protein